jgi:hypothetical protein
MELFYCSTIQDTELQQKRKKTISALKGNLAVSKR